MFAAEQLKIATKAEGLSPFLLYPFQARLYAAAEAQRKRTGRIRQIWCKSRQIGTSTLAASMIFHRAALNSYIRAIIVAQLVGTAQDIFMMARRFYDYLDPALKPMIRYATRAELLFDNPDDRTRETNPGLNSKIIISTARNLSAGRGGTFQAAQITEACYLPNAAEIERSVLQTIPNAGGTIAIIESTPTPALTAAWFRQVYDKAKAGESPYEAHFIPWTDDPTLWEPLAPGESLEPYSSEEETLIATLRATPEQIKWRRMKLDELRGDVDALSSEYPATDEEGWLSRDWMVFPAAQVAALRRGTTGALYHANVLPRGKILRAADGPFAVYEEPQPGAQYDAGADVSLGIAAPEGDWSTVVVVKRGTSEQVAEYRAKLDPGEFADVIASVGWLYNTAQVNPEANSMGLYTVAELFNRVAYPNVYFQRRLDHVEQRMSKYGGFQTTLTSKKLLISHAKDKLYRWYLHHRERFPLVRSAQLWDEIRTFVQEPGTDSYHAAPRCHDDLVMAWCLALIAAYDDPTAIEPDPTPVAQPNACPTCGTPLLSASRRCPRCTHESVLMRADEAMWMPSGGGRHFREVEPW